MLGSAPGTDLLNKWVADADGGMSVDDLANHIADTSGFQADYPTFLTNKEFAESFLGNMLVGLSDELMMGAVDLVAGLLDGGLSRGSLALAVVDALYDINKQGMDHAAYADLGMSAMTFANKIEVASHHTLAARMAEPSADVIADVTADADSAAMAIDAIDNPPEPPAPPVVEPTGVVYKLKTTRDDEPGSDLDDTFIAEPVEQGSSVYVQPLQPFDSLDGGEGYDTLEIYDIGAVRNFDIANARISNIEKVVVNAHRGVIADLEDWTGLEMVELERFGKEDTVDITVNGATVVNTSNSPYGGKSVSITGSMGAVDLVAGKGTAVNIGSGEYTTSVMVKGGASLNVDNGAGKPSDTVTMVSVDGVQRDLGDNGELGGSKDEISEVLAKNPDYDTPEDHEAGPTATNRQYLTENHDNETVPYHKPTEAENSDANGVGWYNSKDDSEDVDTSPLTGDDAAAAEALYNKLTTNDPEKAAKTSETETITVDDDGTSVHVYSNAIEGIHLSNNDAIVLVYNNSMIEDEDGELKGMPEDLAVTVDSYGKHVPGAGVGKLCIDGAGSAENISINVVDDSNFALASNKVKTLNIMGDGKLTLDVNKFKAKVPDDGPSRTLETVTVAGETGLTANLFGHAKLTSVDASGSMGNNALYSLSSPRNPTSLTELDSLEMVQTGSGKDVVSLATSVTGKLEMVNTGSGNDSVTIAGSHRIAGIEVDLGEGNDAYTATAGSADNNKSRVDGGDGRDTLSIKGGHGATYKDAAGDTHSIYKNFEILDVSSNLGSNNEYNLKLLGIDSVTASRSASGVALEDVAGGTPISISGSATSGKAGVPTSVTLSYELVEDVTKAGSLIGGKNANLLNVSLTAAGGNKDTDAEDSAGTGGEATLSLSKLDENIRGIIVDSSARLNAKPSSDVAPDDRPDKGDYRNVLDLATANGVREVEITGNSQVELKGTLASLELVDASENEAGVIVSAASSTQKLTVYGSDEMDTIVGSSTNNNELFGNGGVDTITGGITPDEITGGLGGDTLTGLAGEDMFRTGVADSQLSYTPDGRRVGIDTITDFQVNIDKILLSKTLYQSIEGGIKGVGYGNEGGAGISIDGAPNTVAWVINNFDTNTPDATINDFDAFVRARTQGFFLTKSAAVPNSNNPGSVNKFTIALVEEYSDASTVGTTWVFIDANGNGNFDMDSDMVIKLTGDLADAVSGLDIADFGPIS